MFKFKKDNQCPLCKKNTLNEDSPQLRMDTAEGVHEVTICESCADFLDKTADVLNKNRGSRDESV